MTTSWRTASPRPLVSIERAEQPRLSCLLVTYGTGPIIVECLAALRATVPADVPFEVIVVDNAHPAARDRTWRLLSLRTSGVRVVRPRRNLGFAGGNNLAADIADGELLLVINPDVVVHEGWFEPLAAALDEASIAAPVLYDADGNVDEAGQALTATAATRPVRTPPPPGEMSRPTYASAACWLVRAAEFERLGGFDEGFHPAYYEDVDFGLRAARDGTGTVVAGAAGATHHRGGSTADADPPSLEAQHARLMSRWGEVIAEVAVEQ